MQDKAGPPECQKVQRQPLALQFATGAHPAVLTCTHTHRTHGHAHGTRACTRHVGTCGGRCPQAMHGALCAAGVSQQLVAGLAPVEEETSVALEALGERGGQTAASEKGCGPLDTGSNRTFRRGDRGGDSLCGGSGGRVRWGGDVIVYTSRDFALFSWQEQVHLDRTWTSRTQADLGPVAPLDWMAETGLGCSPPSACLEGATSPAPSATAGWRPPAWPGSPGCGRDAPWGRRVFSLAGGSWLSRISGHRPGAHVQPPCWPRRGCQVTCESLPGLGAL